MNVNNWLQTLVQLQQQAIPCVLVTVASTIGSTPREAGSRMIVTETGLFGTIGGGNLEYQACRIAREQLHHPQPHQLKRFPLGAGLGQCCGGLVNLLFEPLLWERMAETDEWIQTALDYQRLNKAWVREVPLRDGDNGDSQITVRTCMDDDKPGLIGTDCFVEIHRSNYIELTLFGAGHVGHAIVNKLQDLPVKIRWVDNRDNAFPLDPSPQLELIGTDTPEAEVDAAGSPAYFLVMTHDHSLDQVLCEAILQRDDIAYFGLIGSKSKRRLFETRLQRRGIDANALQRMICPIGIDGIHSKHPAMIAVSVIAQIMQVYHACDPVTQAINAAEPQSGSR